MGKEDIKYGVIGVIVIRILDMLQPKGPSKPNFLTEYFKTTSKKQVFKDFWFIISTIGFFIFAYWVTTHWQDLTIPSVTDINTGVTMKGNCTFVYDYYKGIQKSRSKQWDNLDSDFISNLTGTYGIKPIGLCPNVTLCPHKECPTLPPTTTTIAQECPACNCVCPQCQTEAYTGLPRQTKRAMLNIKPGPNGSPAYSGGCYDCLEQAWSIAGIPTCAKDNPDKGYCVSRFNPAPNTGYYQHYKDIQDNNEKECKVCFLDLECDQRFILNNSLWGLVGNGSTRIVYKIEYPKTTTTSTLTPIDENDL